MCSPPSRQGGHQEQIISEKPKHSVYLSIYLSIILNLFRFSFFFHLMVDLERKKNEQQ